MKCRTLARLSLRHRPLLHPAVGGTLQVRAASNLSQRPDSTHLSFPGALKSAFTSTLKFENPETRPTLPTYRVVDQHGVVVDQSFEPDISDEKVIELYKNMLFVSVMDLIMFDAQRQGRVSFYMVSAGEEAVSVGSTSVLDHEDVIFCQYREQGAFRQRGFTSRDFMGQLLANVRDPSRGRNMPVHYGSKELNIVSSRHASLSQWTPLTLVLYSIRCRRRWLPSCRTHRELPMR